MADEQAQMTKTEASHTPGPWNYEAGQLDYHSEDGGGGFSVFPEHLDRTGGGTVGTRLDFAEDLYPHDGKQYEVAEANARLIAASPDMLETLEEVKDYLEHEFKDLAFYPEIYKAVDRVIDKATGKDK